MPNTFEILNGFLVRFGNEVEGRQSADLPAEVMAQLRSFARGQLPAAEQEKLIQQLNDHPDWVIVLAAEAKALREPDPPNR